MRLTNLLKDPHCVAHCGSAASGCTEKSQHELLFNCPSIHNDTTTAPVGSREEAVKKGTPPLEAKAAGRGK